ncbi:Beta-ketoacyl synthase domain-containing protein [Colletotrichum sp. SAR 10_70]|nr:Beta-ketoacyl synthase domain-containing protein [Colletotrichum sp. SAR 10_71]KAI8201099.1 Beta-ketoacyl synthase domain-containing protein [Colletotrichum sp. SAR 10_70]KAI8251921.1 Beta-ketoacyl synthase domain-containing protein [Colletotrichum sp. SAR 10_77]
MGLNGVLRCLQLKSTLVVLSEIDVEIFAHLDEAKFEAVRNLLFLAGKLLWLTESAWTNNPHQASIIGMLRSIAREHPEGRYHDPSSNVADKAPGEFLMSVAATLIGEAVSRIAQDFGPAASVLIFEPPSFCISILLEEAERQGFQICFATTSSSFKSTSSPVTNLTAFFDMSTNQPAVDIHRRLANVLPPITTNLKLPSTAGIAFGPLVLQDVMLKNMDLQSMVLEPKGSTVDIGAVYGVGFVTRAELEEDFNAIRFMFDSVEEDELHTLFAEAVASGKQALARFQDEEKRERSVIERDGGSRVDHGHPRT